MKFTAAQAHVILGAFSVCYSEGISGINYGISAVESDAAEIEIWRQIKDEHPKVFALYAHAAPREVG